MCIHDAKVVVSKYIIFYIKMYQDLYLVGTLFGNFSKLNLHKRKNYQKNDKNSDNSHGNSNFLTNFIINTRNTELTYT